MTLVGEDLIGIALLSLNGCSSSSSAFSFHFYRPLNGVILVYDITNEESFKEVEFWRKEILQLFPKILLCLVGNKVLLLINYHSLLQIV